MDVSGLKVLDSLRTILRYLMSGVVFMLASYILNERLLNELLPDLFGNVWLFFVLASVIGFFAYAVHQAFLDNILFLISVYILWIISKSTRLCIKKIRDKVNENSGDDPCFPKIKWLWFGFIFRLLIFEIDRSGTKVARFLSINRKLREAYNIMVFMYCCSYLLFAVYFLHSTSANINEANASDPWNSNVVFWLGVISFFTGLFLDCKTTRRDIWFITKFQLGEDLLYPKEETSCECIKVEIKQ